MWGVFEVLTHGKRGRFYFFFSGGYCFACVDFL